MKWRGQLFHQFLRALVDDSHQVRSLAHHLLAEALATKVGCPIRAQQHTSHNSPKGAEHGSCNLSNPSVQWRHPSPSASSACWPCTGITERPIGLQAPLLAYNHFVEAVFVLNECRPGLQATAAEDDPVSLTQIVAGPAAQGAYRLTGPDPAIRAKRDTIYR